MANLLSSTIGSHFYGSYNQSNILLKTAGNTGDGGILLQNSAGAFKFQIYGNGTDYGFLDGTWADWDIRKTIDGRLYLNGTTSYYLQTNAHSYLSTLHVGDASNGVSLHVGSGSTYGVYTLDNARKYLVVSGDYYTHMALVATGSNNTNHGVVFSFVGTEGSAARQWNLGISNQNPFLFSIGYNRTGDNNPHYGVGDGWSSEDYNHARLSIDRDGNTKIRGMLYVNGTSGGISTGNAVIHAGNIGSQSVSVARQLLSPNDATVVAADSAMPSAGHSFIHTLALGPGGNDGHILGMSWAGTTSVYGAQIFLDTDPNDIMAIRSRSSTGVWTSWKTVIHSGTIGSQSVNYATSAGTFSTGRTNYKDVTDNAVAGQLMWKNYGNNHTIFDASNGTSPDGGGVNNTNPDVAWTGTYPTLMGWNGSSTYGVRVDSSRNADYAGNAGTLSGLGVTSFLRDDGWNTYPGQDANTQGEMRVDFTYSNNAPYTGELIRFGSSGYSTQFNTSYGNSDNFAFRTRNGDNATWNAWRNVIHSGNIGSQSVSYASSAGNADTLDSLDSSEFARGRAAYQVLNLDDVKQPGLYQYDGGIGGTQPAGTNWYNVKTIEIGSSVRYSQFVMPYSNNRVFYRYRTDAGWQPYVEFITSGNIASQSVSYADESGYSASTGTTDNIGGVQFRNTGSGGATNADTIDSNGITYYTSGVSNFSGNATDGALYSQRYSTSWQHQIAGDYRSGQIALRGRNNGTWQSWRTVLDSSNFTSWAQEKENQRLSTSNGPTFANVYTAGWFRNYGAQGMYNQDYGTHFYSNGGASWAITGSGGNVQLEFRSNHQSTIRGYVYADTSNQIGFLNNGGSWAFRTTSDNSALVHGANLTINADGAYASNITMNDGDEGGRVIHCNSNRIGFLNQSSSWGSWCYDDGSWATGVAMYSPIYYDSDDTNYYINPNGVSRIYRLQVIGDWAGGNPNEGAINIRGNYPSMTFRNTISGNMWLRHMDGSGHIQHYFAPSGVDANDWSIKHTMYNNGTFQSNGSMRAPIFYSSVDTNYFWEPNVNSAHRLRTANGYVDIGPMNSSWCHFQTDRANFYFGSTVYADASGFATYGGSTSMTKTDINSPIFLVPNHSDNTKGYRIYNTSSSSVSAMFVNSANALVIAAGAVDQVQMNKKVFISGAALGVNIAASATAGRIDASNDIVAYSTSDERFKENITPIANALDKVKTLTGVEFDWRMETKDYHGYVGHDVGVIAQQVKAVLPEAVRTNANGYLAVRYEKLIGLLIEANKELAARVEELEKKLN
jgi:hypothetical protein